jgi:hypothetical protein
MQSPSTLIQSAALNPQVQTYIAPYKVLCVGARSCSLCVSLSCTEIYSGRKQGKAKSAAGCKKGSTRSVTRRAMTLQAVPIFGLKQGDVKKAELRLGQQELSSDTTEVSVACTPVNSDRCYATAW